MVDKLKRVECKRASFGQNARDTGRASYPDNEIMFKSHDTSFIPKGIHVCYQIVYSAMVDIVILRKRIKRNTGQLRSQRRYSTTMASCMDRQCSTVLQQEDPFRGDRQQN